MQKSLLIWPQSKVLSVIQKSPVMMNAKRHLADVAVSLENKCENLEARSRRTNIRIMRVPGTHACSASPVAALLKEALGLKGAPLLDRAHRSLLQAPKQGAPPRIIIAQLHYLQECANILPLAWEKQQVTVNGLSISVFPDYTTLMTV